MAISGNDSNRAVIRIKPLIAVVASVLAQKHLLSIEKVLEAPRRTSGKSNIFIEVSKL